MGRSLRAALAVGLFVVAGTAFAAPPDVVDLAEAIYRRDFRRGGANPVQDRRPPDPDPARQRDARLGKRRSDARVKVVSWMSESVFQRYYSEPADLPTDKAGAAKLEHRDVGDGGSAGAGFLPCAGYPR